MICEDIKIGGTVTTGGITGGTSVSNYGLMVADYSNLWGTVAKRASIERTIGQAGGVITGQELPDARIQTLSLRATDMTSTGGGKTAQQLWDNQDTLTSLFTATGGAVIEWILPTESRWTRAYALNSAGMQTFGKYRTLAIPLTSPWPYWQSDTQESQVVNGAGVSIAALGGTVQRVYNPTIVFSADGTFTDVTSGLAITVTGSAAPVTVSRDSVTGRWSAVESGAAVPGKISVNDSRWMFLTVGGTFTSTVSCTVYWRDQWE